MYAHGQFQLQAFAFAEILAAMPMVAEGVPTTYSAYECARKVGVETPIIAYGKNNASRQPQTARCTGGRCVRRAYDQPRTFRTLRPKH